MTPILAPRRTDRSFERIYRRHVGDVYRYALAVLRNSNDAEDVTQTTFMNAYRAYARGERPRNAQNWLITIAHNVCRQRFRQSARRPEEVAYDDGIGGVVPEEEQGPTAEDIQRALGHLAFNQRAALVMRELEGRSYAEIAEILDISVSAVETLLFRARRALREQLEGALTCTEAERAISKEADGLLPRSERAVLRAHLRECRECDRFARSQRAQRSAFKALAAIPIPASLTSLFGGGSGAAVGAGLATKAAAVVAVGVVATSVGGAPERTERVATPSTSPAPAATAAATPAPVWQRPFAWSADARPRAEVRARPRGPADAAGAKSAARAAKADRAGKARGGVAEAGAGRALGHGKQKKAKKPKAATAPPRATPGRAPKSELQRGRPAAKALKPSSKRVKRAPKAWKPKPRAAPTRAPAPPPQQRDRGRTEPPPRKVPSGDAPKLPKLPKLPVEPPVEIP